MLITEQKKYTNINEALTLVKTLKGNDQTIHSDLVTPGEVAKTKTPLGKKEDSLDEVIEEINEAKNIFKTIIN